MYGRKVIITHIKEDGTHYDWIIYLHRTNERSIPFYTVKNEITYQSHEDASKDCDQVFKDLGLKVKQNFISIDAEPVLEKTN